MMMVQKPQTVKNSKLKPPPPVPPRPNQNVVAEALAKTRKAVAESKVNMKPKTPPKIIEQKSKTLERTNSTGQSLQNVSPKMNGLARVKSFIRDVIIDRNSSEERKSGGSNSRRSSAESTPIPASVTTKNNLEQKHSNKTIKNCRQALVRSLSTSTKLEQDTKGKVLKSSGSFAEKSLPLRRAPPPPLSPKPKLRELKQISLPNRRSLERIEKPKDVIYREYGPKNIQAPIVKKPESPVSEAPYATVDEVVDFDNRLSSSYETVPAALNVTVNNLPNGSVHLRENGIVPRLNEISESLPNERVEQLPNGKVDDTPNGINCTSSNENIVTEKRTSPPLKNTNSLERKTSRVTERLISEIIASRNKSTDLNTVIDKGKTDANVLEATGIDEAISEGENRPKDMNNHEMLIYELQTMHSESHIPEIANEETLNNTINMNGESDKCSSGKSSPVPSIDLSEHSENSDLTDTCDDDPLNSRLRKQFRAISSMSLQGLPPLPKSLSGFAEGPLGQSPEDTPPSSPEDSGTRPTDMDSQLALLKKEMASLRRLDLSLLSELWSLNEAMAAWRQQLERAPRLRPAPPPPPPPIHYLRT